MNKYCIVLSTFASAEQAQKIINLTLSQKLAACIQVLDIKSHYVWENEVCHDPEVLVLFKTSLEKYQGLKTALENTHPYDTPEIVKVDITDGSSPYLRWIDESTLDCSPL